MSGLSVSPFTLRVEEVFALHGGVTVFVGNLESGSPKLLAPCTVELFVEGASRGTLELESERMPGPKSMGRRAVETRAALNVAELRGRQCLLVHR